MRCRCVRDGGECPDWWCARHWTKPGGTYEQFVKDSYDCAQQHTWEGDVVKEMYRACLQGRGYRFERGGEWQGVRD